MTANYQWPRESARLTFAIMRIPRAAISRICDKQKRTKARAATGIEFKKCFKLKTFPWRAQ
jgi:hypothetical protein